MRTQGETRSLGVKVVMSACVIAACAGFAMAKPAPAGKPEHPGHKQPDVLGGPKVKDDAKPGEMGRFAPREGRKDEIPHTMVVRFLKRMASDQTPEDVRLSAEQATKIEEMEKSFQEEIKAYRDKNREEVMKLREVLPPEDRRRVDAMLGGPEGPRGRGGEGPRGERPEGKPGERGPDADKPGERRRGPRDGDEMDDRDDPMQGPPASREEVEKAKGRLKEIAEGAPQAGPVNEKMYGVLNETQRDYAKKQIEKQRDEMRKRAEERAKERGGAGERGKGGDGERMPPGVREKIEKLSPEEREKLKAMSPEDRRAYLRKLMGEEAK